MTKLATAVTVLATRGPAYSIPTRAVAGPNPGEVILVGGGDPTLAVNENGYYRGAARLDDLAAQLRRRSVAPRRRTSPTTGRSTPDRFTAPAGTMTSPPAGTAAR